MKRSHRTLLCILLLALFLLTIFPVSPAFADEEYPETPVEEEPYETMGRFYPTLSFSNGMAVCSASVFLLSGYSGYVTIKLKENGHAVQFWIHNLSAGQTLSYSDQRTVVHGRRYQVIISATIFNSTGNVVETPSNNTAEYTY